MNREDLHKRLLATFREEAAELLQALGEGLDAVTDDPQAPGAREHLDALFRVMHTLKGAARSVQFLQVEKICQECEVELRAVTRGERQPSRAFIDRLTDATDRLRKLIDQGVNPEGTSGRAASTPASPPAGSVAPAAHPAGGNHAATDIPRREAAIVPSEKVAAAEVPERQDKAAVEPSRDEARLSPPDAQKTRPKGLEEAIGAPGSGSVRVDVAHLDRLLLTVEDLLLPSLVASERVKAARQMTQDLTALRGQLRSNARRPNAPENSYQASRETLDALRELEQRSRQLAASLADDQRALRSAVGDLFQETRRARMVPAASMLVSFPAMVRDLCRETGKDARWSVNDAGLDLDRKVIELIKAPLIHLVRNAIDHGIEKPEQREAMGKPKRSSVSLSIMPAEQGRIVIEVADDGRGMDLDALRDAAVRSRTASAAQVKAMSDEDLLDIAFRPGVSTTAVITSISGLGLGLSIVREQVERIDGRVVVSSVPGKGTKIRLEIPSTVASYRGLLVLVSGARLLWPAEAVERVIGVSKPALAAAVQSGIMVQERETLPFGYLGSVMGIAASRRGEGTLTPCVIVGNAGKRAIFAVDEILGETEVLVKDFPRPLRRVRNVSSVGLLATGKLALVLRPADLLTSIQVARTEGGAVTESATRTMKILVVDDSITTRTMERNLLEAAGYEVSVAADGVDAWSVLQEKEVDLVVSDIDMPRMNGFELTSRIRGDGRFSELPIVLVTALESREDKERGIKIGANAYVLKSSFEQSKLLEIVGRLI